MSLKKSAIKGVKWTGYSTVITTILQFIQLAVLAHLLSPEAFGLMAIIMLIIGFAQAYADMGMSNAIIHHQKTSKNQLSTLYWLNIIAGVTLFSIMFLLAPFIANYYRHPQLIDLIRLTALSFLITPIGQQFQVLLQKELEFRSISLIEIISVILGTSIAITTAFLGYGVYAIVWGLLANIACRSLLLTKICWEKHHPSLYFKLDDLKGYIGFGLYQMGEKSINYLNSRLDQILIGAFLGIQALGYYNLAFNLVIQPVSKINPIITRVALPIFSKIQNDTEKLKRGYLLTLQIISFINFPLLIGLAVTAPLLIPLLFGEQWTTSILLVQILSFVAIFRSQGNPIGSLLLAKGRADWGFKWNTFLMVSQTFGVFTGLKLGGLQGVAWSLLILQILYLILNYIFLVKPLIKPSIKEYSLSLLPYFLLSLLMGFGVYSIPFILEQSPLFTFIMQILTGICIYSLLNFIFNLNQMKNIRDLNSKPSQQPRSC